MRKVLRTRWGLISLLAALAGIACLYAAWAWQDNSWLSGLLVNLGTGLVLFLPLVVIGYGVERRLDDVRQRQVIAAERQEQIEQRQDEVNSSVTRLQQEVAKTQDELRMTREQLSNAVTSRLAATRDHDSKTFDILGAEPKQVEMFKAIKRAIEIGLVDPEGPRVAVPDVDLYVRIGIDSEKYESDVLVFYLETASGYYKSELPWHSNESATDILIALGELMQSISQYPGDKSFASFHIFADVQQLLDIAYEWSASGKSAQYNLGPIIQIHLPQWAVTVNGISRLDRPGYSITASRLEESWEAHMSEKPWVDQDLLSDALASARALYHGHRLRDKPKFAFEDDVF